MSFRSCFRYGILDLPFIECFIFFALTGFRQNKITSVPVEIPYDILPCLLSTKCYKLWHFLRTYCVTILRHHICLIDLLITYFFIKRNVLESMLTCRSTKLSVLLNAELFPRSSILSKRNKNTCIYLNAR